MTTTRIFEQTQFAEASYGAFPPDGRPDPEDVRRGLLAIDFASAQVTSFQQKFSVLHHRPNTATGFSATLFESRDPTNPGLTLAFRGTEPGILGLGVDVVQADLGGIVITGAALRQIVDLYNYWQQLTAREGGVARLARIATTVNPNASGVFESVPIPGARSEPFFTYRRIEFFDAPNVGLGVVNGPVANLAVTGHSLGGHLATAFERLFPGIVGAVYTVNGAGTRDSNTVTRFFDALAEKSTSFTASKIFGMHGSAGPNFVAGELVFDQIGDRARIFTEGVKDALGHGNAQMTDSAAVYDLFIRMDSSLQSRSPSESAQFLFDVFKTISPSTRFALESVVNMLGKLFVPGYAEISPGLANDREALYQRINTIRESLPQGGMTLDPLIAKTAASVAGLAKGDVAYRYALRELNPVAIVGADYSRFATELTLYDSATDQGSLSHQWLEARADALAAKTLFNRGEATFTRVDDNITDFHIGAGLHKGLLFGTDGIDTLSGGVVEDRIFGGAGGDTLSGGPGADYIEGNDGFDTIDAGFGSDEVLGGLGNDTITGSLGDDRLYGGAGEDTIDGGIGDDVIFGDNKDDPASVQITGDDTLRGGTGKDHLYGGGGADTLQGGAGGDWLEGGAGFDTYVYESGDGFDTIADSDGAGRIVYSGRTLAGGQRTAERVFEDAAGTRYALIGSAGGEQGLVIDGALFIESFSPGDLGIVLGGTDARAEPPSPTPTRFYDNDSLPDDVDRSGNFWPYRNNSGSDDSDSFFTEGPHFVGRGGDDVAVAGARLGSAPIRMDGGAGEDFLDASLATARLAAPAGGGGDQVAEDEDEEESEDLPDLALRIPAHTVFLAGGGGADYLLGGSGNDQIWGDNYKAQIRRGPGGSNVHFIDAFLFDLNSTTGEDWGGGAAKHGLGEFFSTAGMFLLGGDSAPERVKSEQGPERAAEFLRLENWVFPDGLPSVLEYVVGPAGQSFDDYIDAGAGDDAVNGGSGSDEIHGGAGNDVLGGDYDWETSPAVAYARLGPEFGSLAGIFGIAGDDVIDGGDGDDRILDTKGGNDTLIGGDGNDVIESFGNGILAGSDLIDAGEGDDIVFVGSPAAVVLAGGGNDRIDATGNVFVDGGTGDDVYLIGNGSIRDSEGDDTLQTFLRRTDTFGRTFDASWALDLDRGSRIVSEVYRSSNDLVQFSSTVGVGEKHSSSVTTSLVILDWYAGAGARIEHVVSLLDGLELSANEFETWGSSQFGTSEDETFEGGDHADEISALAGNDTVFAGDGDDKIAGGRGDDLLDGGAGNDQYFYAVGHGHDTIFDAAGLDELRFASGIAPNDVTTEIGPSSLVLRLASGSIEMGIFASTPAGQEMEIDRIAFADGTSIAVADLFSTAIVAQGTTGDDILVGNDAANTITGGPGNDRLRGGAGDDVYRFSLGDGVDSVSDIAAGDINAIQFGPGITSEMLSLATGSLVIRVGSGGDEIHLENVNPGDVSGTHDVERFVFDDGTELSYAQLLARGIHAPPEETAAPAPGPDEQPTLQPETLIEVPNEEVAAPSPEPVVQNTPQSEVPALAPLEPLRVFVTDAQAELVGELTAPIATPSSEHRQGVMIESGALAAPISPPAAVGVPLDPLYREMQERMDVLLQVGRTNLGERYADAVREFEERRRQREAPPEESQPPSDEEIGAWNATMHAWHERNPGFSEIESETRDGAWIQGWAFGGGERVFDNPIHAVSAPGLVHPSALPALSGAARSPAISEGIRDLLHFAS